MATSESRCTCSEFASKQCVVLENELGKRAEHWHEVATLLCVDDISDMWQHHEVYFLTSTSVPFFRRTDLQGGRVRSVEKCLRARKAMGQVLL